MVWTQDYKLFGSPQKLLDLSPELSTSPSADHCAEVDHCARTAAAWNGCHVKKPFAEVLLSDPTDCKTTLWLDKSTIVVTTQLAAYLKVL